MSPGVPAPVGAWPLLPLAALLVALASCEQAPRVHERTDFVMGTVAQLKVVSADEEAATSALQAAYDALGRIETLTTPHSEFSDVSRLGAAGRGERVPIADETRAIFDLAFRVQAESDSAFSPTLWAVVQLWGFAEEPAVPESGAVKRALREKTYDLGGVAKGYGVDLAAEALGRVGGCIVNVGGDLAVRGSRPDGERWLVGIQDPRDPSQLFLRLRLPSSVAVATSGDYQRYVEKDGVRYHHILDPRTGWPAKGVRSVTVIAPSCALADAWATAAFVLGPEAGLEKLEAHKDLEGVIVTDGENGELVLHRTSRFDDFLEAGE